MPLILAVGLQPSLPRAEDSSADDRVLRVQDGTAARQVGVVFLEHQVQLPKLPTRYTQLRVRRYSVLSNQAERSLPEGS